VTLTRLASNARLTRFVEIGPMVVIAPAIRDRVFPLDEGLGMGWGLEFRWALLSDERFRLGVLDCVVMVHDGPIGATYDGDDQLVAELADEAGGYSAVTRTLAYWRPWQRRPPWCRTAGGS
jgi:hypothetical protein